MKVIPVKIKNKKASTPAFVDDEDYELLKNYKWSLAGHMKYARTSFTNRRLYPERTQIQVKMHKIILWCPKGMVIDHKDGNSLNNQKNNLRICLPEENIRNRGITSRNRSGFKGISWVKNRKKWAAEIGFNSQRIRLGFFKSKEDAVKAYREAALKYHGEFARW